MPPSLLAPSTSQPATFGPARAGGVKRYSLAAGDGSTLSVQKQDQPGGDAGSLFSLMQVARKVVEGKDHPVVRSWATHRLAEAGNPKGALARVRVLTAALKAQSGWVPDPTDAEMIPSAHLMLGDGKKPPFFALGDCDDLTVAWGAPVLYAIMALAAQEAVGVRAAVVGHSYRPNGQIEHVLGGFYDEGRWWYAEPSIPEMPFGEAKKPTREYVILVPSLEVLCDAEICLMPGGAASTAPPAPRRGDFLSVSGVDPLEERPGMRADNASLLDHCDTTGICHAVVTRERPVTMQQLLNVARFQEWSRAFVKYPDIPALWAVPNLPIEEDGVAQSELVPPMYDGMEPRSGEAWQIPNSGFLRP